MSGKVDWLRKESVQWVEEGLLDNQTADSILARYPERSGGWLIHSITAFGAVTFGLGIILAIAYNWAAMPKALKLVFIFAGLILSHGLGWLLSQRSNTNSPTRSSGVGRSTLGEGFHLLGTMLFGAGIFLIAQIYHLDEHYPTAFLIWGCGALAMAWAMPSNLQALLALAALAVWGGVEINQFDQIHWLAPLLIILCLVSFAWIQRSRFVLFVSLGVTLWLCLLCLLHYKSEVFVVHLGFLVSILMLMWCLFFSSTRFPHSRSIVLLYGAAIYGWVLVWMLFEYNLGHSPSNPADSLAHKWKPVLVILPVAVIVIAAIVSFLLKRNSLQDPAGFTIRRWQPFELLHSILFLVTSALVFTFTTDQPVLIESQLRGLLANAVLFGHGLLLMLHGIQRQHRLSLLCGTLIVLTVVAVRFFNLFDSLLARSLVFLLVGAALFYIGYRLSRMSAHKNAEPGDNTVPQDVLVEPANA